MLFIENHTSHRRVASFAWRRLLVPRFPGGDGLFFQAGLIELSPARDKSISLSAKEWA